MFDMDEQGRKAAEDVAKILPPGKAYIANLPYKDACETLQKGKVKDLLDAIHQAKEYRPDGIVNATDFRDQVIVDESQSPITYPFSLLNEVTGGVRFSELTVIGAGSGTGKTTLCRELAHHFLKQGENVGLIMLEEAPRRTVLGMVGIEMSKNITIDRTDVTDEEIHQGFDSLFGGGNAKLYLNDAFGSTDLETVQSRIEHMVLSMGCRICILDHVSIMVSGTAHGQNERTLIDYIVTSLRQLVQRLGCSLFVVSHLRRPDGNRGHENGAEVHLSQLRGSHSIAQLADMVIALQVDADDPNADIRTLHILKNRWSGMTGPAGVLQFSGKRADCAKMPWPSSNKNKKRMSTMQAANDNEAAWRDFHEANPNVYRLIERFTKQAIGAGFKHYGMMSIIQRVRWHTQIETDDLSFKINNNHAPYYARHFMEQNPEHEGFFRTRRVGGAA